MSFKNLYTTKLYQYTSPKPQLSPSSSSQSQTKNDFKFKATSLTRPHYLKLVYSASVLQKIKDFRSTLYSVTF